MNPLVSVESWHQAVCGRALLGFTGLSQRSVTGNLSPALPSPRGARPSSVTVPAPRDKVTPRDSGSEAPPGHIGYSQAGGTVRARGWDALGMKGQWQPNPGRESAGEPELAECSDLRPGGGRASPAVASKQPTQRPHPPPHSNFKKSKKPQMYQ